MIVLNQIGCRMVPVLGGEDIVVTFQVNEDTGMDLGTVQVTLQVFVDGKVRYEVRNTTDLAGPVTIQSVIQYFDNIL